jgi:Ser-tRNA(Ala) deacylase AlaX
MATAKLTLSVKADTIERAKEYARRNHTSLSKVVQNLLDNISTEEVKNDPLLEKLKNTEIPDWIKQLTITDKPTPDFDHKAEYRKHLEEKYGL